MEEKEKSTMWSRFKTKLLKPKGQEQGEPTGSAKAAGPMATAASDPSDPPPGADGDPA